MGAVYIVYVDDNFHYMDEEERYEKGRFDSPADAIACCKEIVEASLREVYRPGMTADELYAAYTGFGEDPFIVGGESRVPFSAWTYAKTRCTEIAG